MKPLPLKIKRRGVFYEQVRRTDNAAIYSLRYEDGGRIIGHDVFKVRQVGERCFHGNIIPPYEQFPPDEAFGAWAWSYTTLQAADAKYNELIFEEEKKQGEAGNNKGVAGVEICTPSR